MTAAELLRTALEKEHQRQRELECATGAPTSGLHLAGSQAQQRSRLETALACIENQLGAGPRAAFEAAVFALAGVDP